VHNELERESLRVNEHIDTNMYIERERERDKVAVSLTGKCC